MRLVSYTAGSGDRLGAMLGEERVVDLQAAAAACLAASGDPFAAAEAAIRIPAETAAFLAGGERSRSLAAAAFAHAGGGGSGPDGAPLTLPRAAVRLGPPLRPSMIICGGGNFWDHLIELGRDKPEHVEFFLKNPHGVLGPEDDIPYQPWLSEKLDYEVEIGIIIGRRGRCIAPEDALDYVYGFTAINDLSIRDRQIINWEGPYFHLKYGEGKTFDGNLVLGPAIVSKEELPDLSDLSLRCWVDGQIRQDSSTGRYIWGVREVVAYYSSIMTLEPGFLICPGTPGGCAVGSDPTCGGKPGVVHQHVDYLRPGQRVTIEVGGIGRLENLIRQSTPGEFKSA